MGATALEDVFTTAEVAQMERVSAYTIMQACREGQMPGAYRTRGNTGQWRIPGSAVLAYRDRNKVHTVDPERIEPRSPRDRSRKRLGA